MDSTRQSDSGSAAMCGAWEEKQGREVFPEQATAVYPLKAIIFWGKSKQARLTVGHCSRCGRQNPLAEPGQRGNCQKCRQKVQEYRRRQKQSPVTVDQSTLDNLQSRVKALEQRVREMTEYANSKYKRGYALGMMHERRAYQRARAEWEGMNGGRADLLGTSLDHSDRKQLSHVFDDGE